MQILTVTNYPIYLPADTAQLPFGDPLEGISCTSASPGVITSPGYNPKNGDRVSLSFTAGGSIPTGLTANTPYYVVSASNDTFSLSATSGGSAINTTSTGANLVLHLLSAQAWGPKLPFKSGDTAIALNLSGSSVTLQSAADVNQLASYPGGPPTVPGGPGTYTTIATIPAGTAASVVLNNDWISLAASGSLLLMQN